MKYLANKCLDIEGFTRYDNLTLMEFILDELNPKYSLEIGTYKGRSAALIVNYSEQTILCDARSDLLHDTVNNLSEFKRDIISVPHSSRNLFAEHEQYFRNVDFAHLDGEHSFATVFFELTCLSGLLSETGVIVMDDMFQDAYPGITRAVYKFLDQHNEFKLVLVGLNKGVIVRTSQYTKWYDFFTGDYFIRSFCDLMPNRYYISKTTEIMDDPALSLIEEDEYYKSYKNGFRGIEHNSDGSKFEKIIKEVL